MRFLCFVVHDSSLMRIGLVVTGGVDRSARERVIPSLLWLIERLARRHELHVFALHHEAQPSTYPLLGATVHDVGRVQAPRGLRRRLQRARLTAALERINGVDVLHAYWALPAGAVTTSVARRFRLPSLVTFDSGELVAIPGAAYGLQRRWLDRRAVAATASRATRLTVCSCFMARLAAARGLRVDVVPLGVDSQAFPATARPEGPPWRLLRVGSINRVKDYPTLLHAMARIIAVRRDVHLDIVGEDTLGGTMQALSRRLNLDAHVTFHGFKPTDELAAFYARAHVHVVSSRHEAAEVVSLEASCAGVPTVGTAVGYVSDGAPARAVAVPIADPDALAAATLALVDDPDWRRRIATAAREWALAHDADWTAARFEQIYGELVHSR